MPLRNKKPELVQKKETELRPKKLLGHKKLKNKTVQRKDLRLTPLLELLQMSKGVKVKTRLSRTAELLLMKEEVSLAHQVIPMQGQVSNQDQTVNKDLQVVKEAIDQRLKESLQVDPIRNHDHLSNDLVRRDLLNQGQVVKNLVHREVLVSKEHIDLTRKKEHILNQDQAAVVQDLEAHLLPLKEGQHLVQVKEEVQHHQEVDNYEKVYFRFNRIIIV